MVGCNHTKQALIIDPARDITPYLRAAEDEGMTIVGVTETHIHADFVSGARELAYATEAIMYLSAMGGKDWSYDFLRYDDVPLRDGDHWNLGSIRIDVIHTPGHTPEHLIFMLTDAAVADKPMALFTGDCLFVGDMGRPDLLETAADVVGSTEIGAKGQFTNVQKLKTMPDYLQVLPGHGAGSACGKSLSSIPSSTLGYEKMFNPAFQFTDEATFVKWLLSGQPETPRYFAQMKRVNKAGAPLLRDLDEPLPMEGFMLRDVIQSGATILDARPDERDGSMIGGAIRIPPASKFSTYAGWVVDYNKPTYLVAPVNAISELVNELRAIGVDKLPGYFPPEEVEADTLRYIPQADIEQARELVETGALPLDVRGNSEFLEGHLSGALNIHYGELENQISALPRDTPILVYCASGNRSQIAASVLDRHGFTNVVNFTPGINDWRRAGMPVAAGDGVGVEV
jgi:hydroxyacylglutathione hydrolase